MSEKEKPSKTNNKRRKRRPNAVPFLILYEHEGTYFAHLEHPMRKTPENAVKTSNLGINTAIAQWLDIGYELGKEREEFPFEIKTQLPKNAKIIGCRPITFIPFSI